MAHRCPKCKAAPALEPKRLDEATVHVCKSCRSVMMTRLDLEALISAVARGSASRPTPRRPRGYFDRLKSAARFVGQSSSIECPACRYNMYEVESRGIVVDFCLNCQAVWFDDGELNTTVQHARKHGAIDLVPSDVEENATALLICYMLETVTTEH